MHHCMGAGPWALVHDLLYSKKCDMIDSPALQALSDRAAGCHGRIAPLEGNMHHRTGVGPRDLVHDLFSFDNCDLLGPRAPQAPNVTVFLRLSNSPPFCLSP
ncbi:hypothetical protein GOP47_0006702 [Adiantum capillus-veneris]|uniref:Uncharacterized protein n=1 Tax=Adiantum capillus-veneris TaxID=13818 RepID=A0A9D4ZMR2_ADICA|nr:hypothetical protein GOP47_0006702 [Adiantum capillus-veneris]